MVPIIQTHKRKAQLSNNSDYELLTHSVNLKAIGKRNRIQRTGGMVLFLLCACLWASSHEIQ